VHARLHNRTHQACHAVRICVSRWPPIDCSSGGRIHVIVRVWRNVAPVAPPLAMFMLSFARGVELHVRTVSLPLFPRVRLLPRCPPFVWSRSRTNSERFRVSIASTCDAHVRTASTSARCLLVSCRVLRALTSCHCRNESIGRSVGRSRAGSSGRPLAAASARPIVQLYDEKRDAPAKHRPQTTQTHQRQGNNDTHKILTSHISGARVQVLVQLIPPARVIHF
jgi:hypothetical protein